MSSIERCPVNTSSKRARNVREEIAEYNINEGKVDWRDNYLTLYNLKSFTKMLLKTGNIIFTQSA